MRVVVVDVETTIRGGKTFGSSPYFPANKMVLLGTFQDEETNIYGTSEGILDAILRLTSQPTLLIGHNITFDLQWMMRVALDTGYTIDLRNITIWDTQQAEYLLSGQDHLYPSLNDCCSAMGLPLKDDKIAKYWEDGVDTEDIPHEELREYLKHDLDVTWKLFLYQQEIFSHLPDLKKLAEIKMEDILYTTLMVWNGMNFDLSLAENHRVVLEGLIATNVSVWDGLIKDLQYSGSIPSQWHPKITSNKDVGTLLFGGKCSWIEEENTGVVFKTGARAGQEKTRKVTKEASVPGLESGWGAFSTKTGWKVDDEQLDLMTKVADNPLAANVATYVLANRALSKELTTYIFGYSSVVSPLTSRIHPTLNHCSTATGRLSCVKPNLQNVSGVEN